MTTMTSSGAVENESSRCSVEAHGLLSLPITRYTSSHPSCSDAMYLGRRLTSV